FHRIFSAVGTSGLFQKVKIAVLFIVPIPEGTVTDRCHCFYLTLKGRMGKILSAGSCIDKEIIPFITGIFYHRSHRLAIRSNASAGRHKIPEFIQTMLKGSPGGHRPHGKTTESAMIPGSLQAFPGGVFGISTVG